MTQQLIQAADVADMGIGGLVIGGGLLLICLLVLWRLAGSGEGER